MCACNLFSLILYICVTDLMRVCVCDTGYLVCSVYKYVCHIFKFVCVDDAGNSVFSVCMYCFKLEILESHFASKFWSSPCMKSYQI